MGDPQSADLDAPHRVLLPELLAPRIGVLSADACNVKVGHCKRSRVAQHASFRRPRHRPADELAAVMIEVWMRDQNRIRSKLLWKVVTEPDATRIRVDQDAAALGGMDTEARVRDRFDRHLTRLQMEPSIGGNVSRRNARTRRHHS